MNISISFIRTFFTLLSVLFLTTYATNTFPGGLNLTNLVLGISMGLLFGAVFIGMDLLFKKYNLRAFNLALLGLFFGYLMGQAVTLTLNAILTISSVAIASQVLGLINTAIYLFCAYIGMIMTVRASDELHLSIPFIKFKASSQKKKDLLIDSSILLDSRIIDLATSGLLDDHLVMSRFALKDLQYQSDNGDEASKAKARRSLEVFKKLESLPTLDMRFSETDFPDTKDLTAKLIQLARMLDCNIITADMTRIQQSAIEGLRIINIHSLSNALKPLTHAGEFLNMKIQRYGKEPRQGVGYLEDGTMVVVNGGAEFIGETIRAQVLSVKHTSSGRMIFCNAADEMMENQTDEDIDQLHNLSCQIPASPESAHKNYFAL